MDKKRSELARTFVEASGLFESTPAHDAEKDRYTGQLKKSLLIDLSPDASRAFPGLKILGEVKGYDCFLEIIVSRAVAKENPDTSGKYVVNTLLRNGAMDICDDEGEVAVAGPKDGTPAIERNVELMMYEVQGEDGGILVSLKVKAARVK